MNLRQEVGYKKWYADISILVLAVCCFLVSILSVSIYGVHIGIVDSGVMVAFSIAYLWKAKKVDFLFIPPILFLVSMGWSVIYNVFFEHNASFSSLVSYIRLVLIFSTIGAAAWATLQGVEKNNKFMMFLFYGLLITSILGIILYGFNIKVSPDQQMVWFEGIIGRLRAGGVVGNTGAYGHQLFLLFSLSIFIMLKLKDNNFKYFLLTLAFSLSFFNIIISSSRGALLGTVSFLVIYLIIGYHKKIVLGLLAVSIPVSLSCAYLFLDEKLLEFSAQRVGFSYLSSAVVDNSSIKDENSSVIADDKAGVVADDKAGVVADDKAGVVADDKAGVVADDKADTAVDKKTDVTEDEKPVIKNKNSEELFLALNKLSSGRFAAWENYATNIYEHFFWGIGYKNSSRYYGAYIDNSFMSVFIEGGVISLIFFSFFWIFLIKRSIDIYKSYDRQKGAFLLSFVIANCLQSFFLDIYSQWISFPVFLFVMFSLLHNKG